MRWKNCTPKNEKINLGGLVWTVRPRAVGVRNRIFMARSWFLIFYFLNFIYRGSGLVFARKILRSYVVYKLCKTKVYDLEVHEHLSKNYKKIGGFGGGREVLKIHKLYYKYFLIKVCVLSKKNYKNHFLIYNYMLLNALDTCHYMSSNAWGPFWSVNNRETSKILRKDKTTCIHDARSCSFGELLKNSKKPTCDLPPQQLPQLQDLINLWIVQENSSKNLFP